MSRRIACKGDCGRWWYAGGLRGRPREWCDECYAKALATSRLCERCGFRRADHKEHDCDARVAEARRIVAIADAYDATNVKGAA